MLRSISIAVLSGVFGLMVAAPALAAKPDPIVTVAPSGAHAFSPKSVHLAQGGSVEWQWASDGFSSTDTSGLGLWDSGVLSSGATFSNNFRWAGTFHYASSTGPSMTGLVHVPMKIRPRDPTTSDLVTFSFGVAPAPPDTNFHVQEMRPGESRWRGFGDGVETSATRVLSQPGLWQFRMQVRNQGIGKTGWSPILSVDVVAATRPSHHVYGVR